MTKDGYKIKQVSKQFKKLGYKIDTSKNYITWTDMQYRHHFFLFLDDFIIYLFLDILLDG